MGRPATGKVPQNAIQTISTRHVDIMYRLAGGQRPTDIAREIGMSQTHLSVVMNSPLFQQKYSEIEAEVRDRTLDQISDIESKVAKLQPKALDTLETFMDNEKLGPALRRHCAKDILDLGERRKDRSAQMKAGAGIGNVASYLQDIFVEAQRRRNKRLENANAIDITPTNELSPKESAAVEFSSALEQDEYDKHGASGQHQTNDPANPNDAQSSQQLAPVATAGGRTDLTDLAGRLTSPRINGDDANNDAEFDSSLDPSAELNSTAENDIIGGEDLFSRLEARAQEFDEVKAQAEQAREQEKNASASTLSPPTKLKAAAEKLQKEHPQEFLELLEKLG